MSVLAPERVGDPLAEDFRKFLFMVWLHVFPCTGDDDQIIPTDLQYDICRTLQKGPRRMIIMAFRGVGKSWITSAFVCWLLYRNPQLKVEVISASKQAADDFATFVHQLINEMEILAHLKSRPGQRDSKLVFDVGPATAAKDPSVKSCGITGQITGSRADVIVADDIEIPGNSMTQDMRDKIAEAVKEFDAILKPGGRVIYLGTPQTEQSLYRLLQTRGYIPYIWPVQVPDPKALGDIYKDQLAPHVQKLIDSGAAPGTPTEPLRFPESEIIERQASYGTAGFSLQFMLDTRLSDADRYPLKLKDLIVMPLDIQKGPVEVAWGSGRDQRIADIPCVGLNGDGLYGPMFISKDFASYTGSVMYVDPSGRGKDETTWSVVNILNGRLFCMALEGSLEGYEDPTLKRIAACAAKYKVNEIIVESNFGDGMFARLLAPYLSKAGHPVRVTDDRQNQMKEMRIVDTLEPLMSQHKLVMATEVLAKDGPGPEFNRGVDQKPYYYLMYQISRMAREKGAVRQDDRIDALAGACAYWVEQMSRDSEQAAKDSREEALNKELEKFMDGVLNKDSTHGSSQRGLTGFSTHHSR